jgi:hypothetical protein
MHSTTFKKVPEYTSEISNGKQITWNLASFVIRYIKLLCLPHLLFTVLTAMRSTTVMLHFMYTNVHNRPHSQLKTQILQSRCIGLSVKVQKHHSGPCACSSHSTGNRRGCRAHHMHKRSMIKAPRQVISNEYYVGFEVLTLLVMKSSSSGK